MTILLDILLVTLAMSILQRPLLVTMAGVLPLQVQGLGTIETTLLHRHLEPANTMTIVEDLRLLFMTETGTLHHHRLTMLEGAMGLLHLHLLLMRIDHTRRPLRLFQLLMIDTTGDQSRGIHPLATLHLHLVVAGLRLSGTMIDPPPLGTILTIVADLLRLLAILLVTLLVLAQSLLPVDIGAVLSARVQRGLLLRTMPTMVMDTLAMCKALRVETTLELCPRTPDLVATWNLPLTDALRPFLALSLFTSCLS